jgi:hypothetical protein
MTRNSTSCSNANRPFHTDRQCGFHFSHTTAATATAAGIQVSISVEVPIHAGASTADDKNTHRQSFTESVLELSHLGGICELMQKRRIAYSCLVMVAEARHLTACSIFPRRARSLV